ncbi:MAG: hypothetical protein M3O36_17965 [Myxococcota bacterium]|nr:hypothetical protein [Myxococcota bacterium]
MIRRSASLLVALLCAAPLGCDKPGATEQQKEMRASEQAAEARNQANSKAEGAQASADKDIAAARNDFEKTREDYRHSRRIDVADMDKKIADLQAEQRTATGKRKADLDANLPSLRAQREAFVRDMQSLDMATASSWDSAKANLDREWDALKAAVDKAR